MKKDALHEGLLYVPFGNREETQISSRYYLDNRKRGNEPFVIFQYTLQGEGSFQLNGETHRVPARHAFIAIPPEASAYRYPEHARAPWIFSWVNFYGDFSIQLWRELREFAGPVVALSSSAQRIFAALTRGVSGKSGKRDVWKTSVLAYRLYLEIRKTAPQRSAADRLQNTLNYLYLHYREPIRVKEVAAQARLTREHFTRIFTQRFGESPAAWLRQMRLKAAEKLLLSTPLPVKEIAFRSGFASAAKFGASFKSLHKMTPEQFRKKRRKSFVA